MASSPPAARPRPPPARRPMHPSQMRPTPEPGPLEATQAETKRERPKGLLTVLAIVGALALAVATVLLVPEDLTPGEQTVLVLLATVVAGIGLVPIRWGWYVMGAVTVAFFALNIYNLLNPGGTIFVKYRGSSYTFAVLMPSLGLLVGAVAQGIYRLVGGK